MLETAAALGAPIVRLWAGRKDPEALEPREIAAFAEETGLLADMAAERGLTLAFECHAGTLTSRYGAALPFLDTVGRENVKMYWQPLQTKSVDYNLAAAAAYAPLVVNVHVFHWTESEKLPLKRGEEIWAKYAGIFAKQARKDGKDRAFCLEFMHDGKTSSLPEEAEV